MRDRLPAGALQGMTGGQNAQDPRPQILGSLPSNRGGGALAEPIPPFLLAGYGQQAQSGVGRGQTMPIPSEDPMPPSAPARCNSWLIEPGLRQQQFGGRMADLLPQRVDPLTAEGELPSGGIGDALGELSRVVPR